jgi:hypothetical protein
LTTSGEDFDRRLMNIESRIHTYTMDIRYLTMDPTRKVDEAKLSALKAAVGRFIDEARRYERWRLEEEARYEAEYAEE